MIKGMLAEMATGEGKTLTATLVAGTAGLAGVPVHVITVNDYLVQRDAELMGPLYRELGLSVGVVIAGQTAQQRQRRLRLRYHLLHQQRAHLRLSPRSDAAWTVARRPDVEDGSDIQRGAAVTPITLARTAFRADRRGRQRADRRGKNAADHFRPRGVRYRRRCGCKRPRAGRNVGRRRGLFFGGRGTAGVPDGARTRARD